MTRRPDFDQLPSPLRRLGVQFRDLEEAENSRRPAGSRRRRPVSMSVAGVLLVAFAAIIAVLDTGGAKALNIINRAPTAAAKSMTVHYRSTISITLGSQQINSFAQVGEIDFADREFSTTLTLSHNAGRIEQRRVGGVLYVAQRLRQRGRPENSGWLAIPLAHEAATTFASAPESEEFTNPLVLLDELAGTKAHVTMLSTANLHGVSTTRYRLNTNLAALLGASPAAGNQPASYLAVAVALVVWLDRQGRPRRVDETVRGDSRFGRASINTVIDFTEYATPIVVEAPANISARSPRSVTAPNPLFASPSRLYERLFFVQP